MYHPLVPAAKGSALLLTHLEDHGAAVLDRLLGRAREKGELRACGAASPCEE